MASQASSVALEALPTELLHRICQFCGVRSALSFCSVNRTIRPTCYDPMLFKKIVQSFLPRSAVENLSRQLAVGNREIRDVILDPVTTSSWSYITPQAAFWARYALATSEAAAVTTDSIRSLIMDPYDPENSLAVERIFSYMPQLLILGHIPSPEALMAVAFAKAVSQVDAIHSDSAYRARFAFCLAAEVLTAPTPRVHGYELLDPLTIMNLFLEEDRIDMPCPLHSAMSPSVNLFRAVIKQILMSGIQFVSNQMNCQLVIASVAQALRNRSIEIPRLTAIPLLVHPSSIKLPLPFTFPHNSHSTDSSYCARIDWERSYTSGTTDPAVLERGEWRGRFMVPGLYAQCEGPAPIKSTVVREGFDNASERVIGIDGSVTTNDDPTRLRGSIRRETGLIRLREERLGNLILEWFGSMTPFGMCGVRSVRGETQSVFWLWQTEQMAEAREVEG